MIGDAFLNEWGAVFFRVHTLRAYGSPANDLLNALLDLVTNLFPHGVSFETPRPPTLESDWRAVVEIQSRITELLGLCEHVIPHVCAEQLPEFLRALTTIAFTFRDFACAVASNQSVTAAITAPGGRC